MLNYSRRQVLTGSIESAAAFLFSKVTGSNQEKAVAQNSAAVVSGQALRPLQARILAYCDSIAPQLLRPAEGVLRYPSISPSLPGKEYSTQLWDWDTYWTARGLFRLAEKTRNGHLQQQLVEHSRGSLLNFLDSQSPEGRLPIVIDVYNGDLFGSLRPNAPNTSNQAKPIMAQLALLVCDQCHDVDWLKERFDQLVLFIRSWMLGNQAACGLLVWSNDVAIGTDNDPTVFGRPFFSSAHLLLNCLFYQELMAAAELARRLGRARDAAWCEKRARELGRQIASLNWDPRDRFFYTVDVQCVDRRRQLIPHIAPGMAMSWQTLPLRIKTFSGFLPLWCGIASSAQAEALLQANYHGGDAFRAEAGVRTLANDETMYALDKSSNPSNWLGPVWILSNYLVWSGLKRYGFRQEADELAAKTLRILAADIDANACMNEYYHPDSGQPLSHKGFVDWNLLALEMY